MLQPRHLLSAGASLCLCLSPATASAQLAAPGSPAPNIVFFLADDMGIGDTSAYQDLTGNADGFQIDTPNMERLASQGVRLTDAHSNASVCTPTRLALLTGIHSFRSPIRQRTSFEGQDTIGTLLQGRRRTVGHLLGQAGYGTYGVGKWHMGLQVDYDTNVVSEGPQQAGFEHWTGTPANFPSNFGILRDSEIMTYDQDFNVVAFGDPGAQAWDPAKLPDDGGREDFTEAIQQTNLDAAQQYLADHQANRSDDPFFLYYASHSNHTPYLAGDTLDGETVDGHTKAGGYLDVPTTTDANGNIVPTGDDYGNVGLDNHWEPYLETDANGNVTRNGPGERATLVDENDVALGKLLDYLEATDDARSPGQKLIDNTLIVFTSDNGSDIDSEPSVGALPQGENGPITDIAGKKANFEEGGTRVPFLAAWGNQINADTTSDALVNVSDMYATFAALAGVDLAEDEGMDSEDVSAALRGDASGDRATAMIYKNRERLILRDGDLKLVATDPDADRGGSKFDGNIDYADLEVFKFYDLGNDLGETNDLSSDPAFASTIQRMLGELQGHVDRGFTRAGAVANANGTNFQGGDVLDAANYLGYGDTNDAGDPGTLALPKLTTSNPNFIFVDGTAGGRVGDAWIIQGNGEVTFNGNQSGVDGSRYELRGGTVTAATAFRIDRGSFSVTGGALVVEGQRIRMTNGDALLELLSGSVEADQISFEQLAGSSDGSKVVRFGIGPGGELTLRSANNALDFGDGANADAGNDYVDFLTGSKGTLLSRIDAAALEDLYDTGFLRVDGESVAGGFDRFFAVADAGQGFTRLSLAVIPEPATAALLGLGLLGRSGRRRG